MPVYDSSNPAWPAIVDRRLIRILAILALGSFLTLVFLNTAVRPLALELDSSGQALFDYYAQNKAQFGKDAVHVVGPYGYVLYHTGYTGGLLFRKILLNLLLKIAFTWLILEIVCRSGRPLLSGILLLSLVVFGSRMQDDFLVSLAQLFAGVLIFSLLEAGIARWRVLLASGFLGFCCLLKGTQALNSLVIIALAAAVCLLYRKWPELWLVLVSFAGVMAAAWMLAAQSLFSLPRFWSSTFAVASGYNEAAALDEQTFGVFHLGLAAAVCLSISIIGHAALAGRRLRTAATAALLAIFSFLEWKHGFVRADGHVQLFFHYGIVTAFFLPLVMSPGPGKGWTARLSRRFSIAVTAAAAFFSFCGARTEPYGRVLVANLPAEIRNRISQNLHTLSNIRGRQRVLDAGLEDNRRQHQLPRIKQAVGDARVDFFGTNLGVMLLNRFNYRPRPVAPAFEAHGEQLMSLNQQFMRDAARRPEYMILSVELVDNRLFSHEDSLTLNFVLQNYQPILVERAYYLVRSRQNPQDPEPVAVSSVTAALRQWVSVPRRADDEVLLASIKGGVTFCGWIRAFLYRPQICNLEMAFGDGSVRRNRLLLANSRFPFVIDPVLHSLFDFYRYFHSKNSAEVDRIRLVPEGPAELRLLEPEIAIQFSKMKRPIVEPSYPPIPTFNKAPVDMHAFAVGMVKDAEGRDAFLLHAPGEMVFRCEAGVSLLSGKIGILPGAYNITDGVEFIVTLERDRGSPVVLWRRLLEPRTRESDRGTQEFSVRIPPGAEGIVRIQTTTGGPGRNSAGDQSYLSDVEFR